MKIIKLKSLLPEVASEQTEFTEEQLFAFFKKNVKKFEKLFDDDEWDDFYDLAFDAFPEADQDDVAQALNKAAMRSGWLSSEETEMPTEKDLEKLSFGDNPGKGIGMDDYDKKQKMPKQSPTDLYMESKKKEIKESSSNKKKDIGLLLKKNKITFKWARENNLAFDSKSEAEQVRDILSDFGVQTAAVQYLFGDYYVKIYNLSESYQIEEAEYRGRKVKLGKPFYTPGGPRKRAVYVRNDKGNVVKVGFGEPGMKIKKNNPARRKSFRARHNCDNAGPRWKARYWSCKFW
jgi:hypothetical protein